MTGRGMTLLEVLLALAMLALIAGAGLSLSSTAAQLRHEHGGVFRWRSAALAAFRAIEADLLVGDFDPTTDRARGTARVILHGSTLSIRTRESGPTRRTYAVRDGSLIAWTSEADRPASQPPPDAWPLLAPVEAIELEHDDERDMLRVELVHPSGRRLARIYRIEGVQVK